MNDEQLAEIEQRARDVIVENMTIASLSELIKADIPALLAEIRRLREECRLADLDAKVNAATADRAEQTVERVRAVHSKDYGFPTIRGLRVEGSRAVRFCRQCKVHWPCATIRALDPQEES